jgi:hypothetical protein
MTAWRQRPEPEKPAWRTRGGHNYRVGDPFGFDALGEWRWAGTVIERAPNSWLRICHRSPRGDGRGESWSSRLFFEILI